MPETLYEKIWNQHVVQSFSDGMDQIFVDLQLLHEVTSPQAFSYLRQKALPVAFPERQVATVDHIIATADEKDDAASLAMVEALRENTKRHAIKLLDRASGEQGIVHVAIPERGWSRPGMVIVCGDSHTSTHGAFGALAFGIGTRQVRDVLATQTVLAKRSKVRRIRVDGRLSEHVTAEDLALWILRQTGCKSGIGFATEYAGSAIDGLHMEERMTLCNMAIEGGSQIGYCNPDETTIRYIMAAAELDESAYKTLSDQYLSYRSDAGARFDDEIVINAAQLKPRVSWGTQPDQNIAIDELIPEFEQLGDTASDPDSYAETLEYMGLEAGKPIRGLPIDVAFIGSCTNSRLSDLQAAAELVAGRKVAAHVRAIVVPGSQEVKRQAEVQGLDRIFQEAGFEWRQPGCSMCIAMNSDRLQGRQICASSSNRNFRGRQGSPKGRTLLMSPQTVAVSAIAGAVQSDFY